MSDGIEVEQHQQIIENDTKPIRKLPMATSLDKESIREAYEDVRSDLTETEWSVFKFDGPQIIVAARGVDFEQFKNQFKDNERAFGYIRIQMGDEMSKRKKFLFLTWIGPEVGVLQRAKMSTDKAIIKDVLNNFAVELQAGQDTDLDIDIFRDALNRAGGANYGTGVRDL
ncbi:coactosin-like protein isoform X2 [Condylostylus longicornis]|uniref:coactosin-like protein isoform X2 n=1 Tax=Condylostylus longicornis TaxID=2530218 RepID=UPI00244E16BA|nr:coactosin-like protein isoform X2 [Condylostylus longicornis]XP_055383172.1 coactosin-like protein isoform X2 [Condylostylus longicornis]